MCFPPFSVFPTSYSVCFSFSKIVNFSPYSRSYSTHFSRHNPGLTLCFSLFSRFSVLLAIFHIIQCAFLIFHPFQCFSPYSRSNNICVSFFTYFRFLAIILVLQCVFLFFHVFHCFFLPYFTSYSVCFSFSMIFSTLAIFQVLPCVFRIFHLFQCFSQYSRSYSVCVSFSTFFSVSTHNPILTVCVSHFP